MDIVARLKEFINYLAIPVTQFADNCKIPRPSLSQLLNGRNKKVSDEFIGKIHDAYPQLSVLWLMFGEGTMLFSSNTKTSELQTTPKLNFSFPDPPTTEPISSTIDFEQDYSDPESEKNVELSVPISPTTVERTDSPSSVGKSIDMSTPPETDTTPPRNNAASPTISFNPTGGKSIVNIIVYYSDNSFESFGPSSNR